MGHVYAVTKCIELECQTNTDRLTALYFAPDVGNERRYCQIILLLLKCIVGQLPKIALNKKFQKLFSTYLLNFNSSIYIYIVKLVCDMDKVEGAG